MDLGLDAPPSPIGPPVRPRRRGGARRLGLVGAVLLACAGVPAASTREVAAAPPVVPETVIVSGDRSDRDFWPSLAATPDGERLVAIWNMGTRVRSATSTDGGANWSDEIELADYRGTDVDREQVIFDAAGNLHAVWRGGRAEARTVEYRYLPAGADPAERKRWRSGPDACRDCINPRLVADPNGAVYVVYDQRGRGPQVQVRRMGGPGEGWSDPLVIGGVGQPSLVVTGDGVLHLAVIREGGWIEYLRFRAMDASEPSVRLTASTAWSNIAPVIAADALGAVHLAYSQMVGEDRIIFHREVAGDGLNEERQVSAAARPGAHGALSLAAADDRSLVAAWTGVDVGGGVTVFGNSWRDGGWGDPGDFDARRLTGRGDRSGYPSLRTVPGAGVALIYVDGPSLSVAVRRVG